MNSRQRVKVYADIALMVCLAPVVFHVASSVRSVITANRVVLFVFLAALECMKAVKQKCNVSRVLQVLLFSHCKYI